MASTKRVRRAGILLAISACLLLGWRYVATGNEARVRSALRNLAAEDNWIRRMHAAVWDHLPPTLAEMAPTLAPVALNDLRLRAGYELLDLAPRSEVAVRSIITSLQTRTNRLDVDICLLQALGKMRDPSAIDPLIALCKACSSLQPIDGYILMALSAIDPTDTRVIDNLLEAFQSDSSGTASDVLQTDASKYGADARKKLLRIYAERPDLRPSLAAIVPRTAGTFEENRAFLITCLRDDSAWVRSSAVPMITPELASDPVLINELRSLLGKLPSLQPPPANDEMRPFLHGSLGPNRVPLEMIITAEADALLDALGRSGRSAAVVAPLLMKFCEEAKGRTRERASIAFWKVTGDERWLRSALTAELDSRAYSEKEHCLSVLAQLSSEGQWTGGTNLWIRLLHDPNKHFRYLTLQRLASLGKTGRFAANDIRLLLSDRSPTVRDAAAQTLKVLE